MIGLDPNQILDDARAFVQENLTKLCQEMNSVSKGNVLQEQDKLWILANMLVLLRDNPFSLARSLVNDAAVNKIATVPETVGWLIEWNDPTYRGKRTVSTSKCSHEDGKCFPLGIIT